MLQLNKPLVAHQHLLDATQKTKERDTGPEMYGADELWNGREAGVGERGGSAVRVGFGGWGGAAKTNEENVGLFLNTACVCLKRGYVGT